MITVWANAVSNAVLLHQLSDYPEDGTPSEQIAALSGLAFLDGFTCVCDDYQGAPPDSDPSLWRWDGSKITAAVPVPQSVTPRQVRLLLLQQGLLANVEQLMATQDQASQITWQYASEFLRNDPLLNNLATNLGLSEEQIDQFFTAAAAL